MQCLYCGAKLGALSSKEFCNKKHQELFREQEAQLSIQRLKEAFSFAGSPTSKSRASTSVLDSPSGEIPPDPEFTSQDPHGRLLEAPASRTLPRPPVPEPPVPEPPPANPNVIYCGPASEKRDTPPNAGFVTADETKVTFRLPFFVRRPEAGETAVEAGAADLVPQLVGEAQRGAGFLPVASLASVDICTVGQPGHSTPKPSLESLYEQLRRPIEDQIRKLAFHVADVSDPVLEPGLIERSREIPVGTNRESAELPIAAAPEPARELRPIAMGPRDPELQLAFAPSSELMPVAAQLSIGLLESASSTPAMGALPVEAERLLTPAQGAFEALERRRSARVRPANGLLESASSMPAMEALPVEAERLAPVPAQGAFQALERRRSVRIRHATHTAADTEALAPGSALQLQVSLRNLAVVTRPAPLAATQTLARATEPEKLEAESYRKAERSYEVRPLALRPREAELPRAVPAHRETFLASLPGIAAGLPQVALSARTQVALGFAITRETHAVLQSAFRTLVPGNVVPAPPQKTTAAAPCTDSSYQKLRAKLRIPSRGNAVQYSKIPVTLIEGRAFAAQPEEQQFRARGAAWPIHEMRPPAGPVRPKILGRPTGERPPQVARYPKVIPASSPAWAATRQPSTFSAPRPFRPSSDLPVRELQAKFLGVASRDLGLPSCDTPSVLAKMQAFVANLGEPEVKARPASGPVPEGTVPICEVRPMVHRRQEVHLPAVVAPHTETAPAILPRLAAPPPQVALPRASQVLLRAIGRLSAALPGSGFESLAAEQQARAQRRNRAIEPAADWPARKLQGKPVQVEPRKLALDDHGILPGQHELPVAPILETREGKMCRASVPTFEVQPIVALKKRKIDRQPVVTVYEQPPLAELKRPTVSAAALATIRSKNKHQLSVTGRAALKPSMSSFQDLPESALSPQHTWAMATQLGPTANISAHVAGRSTNFTAQASIHREQGAKPGSQFGSHHPEFLVARSDCRIFCPPRPLPTWDPEWLGPQQFVRWSSWMERPARLARGGVFKQDPASGSLTLAAAGSTGGLIRIAAWTEASETLDQSTLILQLPRRQGDAVLVQIRPAPAPPAPAIQGPRAAVQTLAASSAPSGTKRQMQWVSVAVPWRPLP